MRRISIVPAIPWAVLVVTAANAENVTELWAVRYDGPGPAYYDGARALAVDRDGNVYVTGLSADKARSGRDGYDFATVKYNKRGQLIWVARCNGPEDGEDEPYDIVVDRMGNAYVAGRSKSATGDLDYAILKYDSEGNEVWVVRYDGGQYLDDRARAIALDEHENVIVTGGVGDPGVGIGRGYATVKYTSDGQFRWARQYPSAVQAEAAALTVDSAGNIYVTGRHALGQQGDDFLTIKYTADGGQEWTTRYDGPGRDTDAAMDIGLNSEGNVVVAGFSYGADIDFATVAYTSAGQERWTARYDSGCDDRATGLVITPDDSVVVTGRVNGGLGTVKYLPSGSEAWAKSYGAGGDGSGEDIATDEEGNIYVTGESGGHYTTVSYSPEGQLRWIAVYESGNPGSDYAYGIAVFGTDVIYVTGQSDGPLDRGHYPDFATLAYFQFTGDCIGNERLRADCLKRCRNGAFEIAGTLKSQLPIGTPVTFTLDGAEPRTETIRPNGKARTKWKRVAEGSHVVGVVECSVEKATDCCAR